ncbi:response regulator [Burkholderia ubonensis]|uniref:response regulator n=1 Tax=Burkholderia ubonensis TaxID=101571 RepID=UPI0009B43CCB|nr:response regulator [Burkholderia ubonensis]
MDFEIRPTATEQLPLRDERAPGAARQHLLRRRNVLFGGGAIATVVLVVATLVGMWVSACDYVAGRYAEFVQHVSWMQRDIVARTQLLRVEHERGKAVRTGRSSAASEVVNAFVHGRGELSMRGNGGTAPIFAAGDLHAPPAMGFARLPSFAQEFSDRIYAYSTGTGALLDRNSYSADGRFIGVVPVPGRPLPRWGDGTIDTRTLIHSMMPDYSPDAEARANSGIEVAWLPLASDPPTGRSEIRAVSKVYSDGRPFLVFVSQMVVDTLLARLGQQRPDEIAWIANADGEPISLAASTRSEHRSIMTTLTNASLPAVDGMKPDFRHHHGRMVFRTASSGGGWGAYQTMTSRTVLHDIWRGCAVVAGLLIGSIAVLWVLLLAVNRRRMPRRIRESARHALGSETVDTAAAMAVPRRFAAGDVVNATDRQRRARDLAAASRVEAPANSMESIDFTYVAFDLASLAHDVAAMLEPSAAAKGLAFTCVIDDRLAPVYAGDPARLREVMINLLRNAIESTDCGEIVFEVYLGDEARPDQITIGVIDSGVGMVAARQQRIANGLKPSSLPDLRHPDGGAMVDRALCEERVVSMGGDIEYVDDPRIGRTCVVRLKLRVVDEPTVSDADETPPGAHVRPVDGFEILIADDYPVTRNILRDRLAKLGHAPDVADDGKSALRMTIGKRYQLLMTDLNMPGMNGYMLARMVRDRDASMPIIAITAHVTEHERMMCNEAGIDEILMKSASLVEIDAAVRRAVERHGAAVIDAGRRAEPADETLPSAIRQELLNTLAASVDRINDAIARLDSEAVAGELHSIKGAFAMVRETAIVLLCERIEFFAREGVLPAVDEINALAASARAALARRV